MPATVEWRVRRLLALLSWISRQGAGTARISDLASRFAMTEQEVVAELELAACCGLPPYSPDQLMELMVDEDEVTANLGPELSRPRRLSPAEGFTLAASARAILGVPGADPDGTLARALSKLEAVLGRQEQVRIDLDDPALLEEVRAATARSERIRIAYYSSSRDEVTDRVVEPHHVFSSGGYWYLDAWCQRAEAARHFRVDRIESVERTGETFPPPGGPPPDMAVGPGPQSPLATVRLPAAARPLVESVPVHSVEQDEDGSLRVELPVGGEAWLARLLLRAGPQAVVLEPASMADVGARSARQMLQRYG